MNIPAELKYTRSHEWIRAEADGTITVGISDHAQELLGDLVFIELPEVGRELAAEQEAAVVESVKAAADVYAPVAGTVVEVNLAVADAPELVNQDAYAAWLFRMKPATPSDLDALLDADAYQQLVAAPRPSRPPPEDAMDSPSPFPRPSLSALEQRDDFVGRHIGPERHRDRGHAGHHRREQHRTTARADRAGDDSSRRPTGDRRASPGRRSAGSAAGDCPPQPVQHSMIGMGYADTLTPAVVLRNVLENPGWYTAYTPYQAEIAQGRLEALLNYQQMVIDLTGLELANASLLDEATAAAEAMSMARRVSKSGSKRFFVDAGCFPQTIDVLKTRAAFFDFELVYGTPDEAAHQEVFGALFQYPDDTGEVRDLSGPIAAVKSRGGIVAVAADLMALVLLRSPGEMGADIALGSAQRFGVPLGFGGPHAAFFATRDAYKRSLAGRIIGVSIDARGKRALRMALQTREQHIRREKANSNICTSQVLLANIAGMYAVYHGPQGLRTIAERIHRLAALLGEGLRQAGIDVTSRHFFDTLRIDLGDRAASVYQAAVDAGYNLRRVSPGVLGIAVNEKTTGGDISTLIRLISGREVDLDALDSQLRQSTRACRSPSCAGTPS
jgi:glycine dehydrogenase